MKASLGRHLPVILVLTVLLAGLCVLSLATGPAGIPVLDVLGALMGDDETARAVRIIAWEIRLPRTLLAILIGAALGTSGAALQGYLRNPLAEPGLLGVSSGAALGAVVALYSGLASAFAIALPLCGLAGAMAAVFVVYLLAGGQARPLTLILAGVAVSAFAGAMTSLALNLAPSPFAALEIVFWMMGSLADRSMEHVQLAAPFIVAGLAVLMVLGRSLDALSLGEDVAVSMGINLARTQALLVTGVALTVGAATSVAGVIGFVGLLSPHLLRSVAGAKPSRLLLLSGLGGACILVAADTAVRLVTPEREMKLGVLTALLGAPFFLWLVIRTRRALML